jgi:hypothetical protein
METIHNGATELVECHSGEEALQRIKTIYDENCAVILELFEGRSLRLLGSNKPKA